MTTATLYTGFVLTVALCFAMLLISLAVDVMRAKWGRG